MKTFTLNLLVISFLFCFSIPLLHAQNEEEQDEEKVSFFDQIHNGQFQKFQLNLDIDYLFANKFKDQYQDAVFSQIISKNEKDEWKIEVKPRGKYRLRTCDFPPLKLKFNKDQLKEKGLKKDNEYKLVTHCMDIGGDESIYREYLIYKLFEILSDKYFRTQLTEITYQDTKTNRKIKSIGIIVEDENQMAKRNNGKLCEACYGLSDSVFNMKNYQIQALFQYMIGNTDWSVPMSRNVKLLTSKSDQITYVVPYDFDFSGLVNASYCVPNLDYGMVSCRQRKYLGKEKTLDELSTTIAHFESKKEEIFSYIERFEYLSKFSKKDIKSYLEAFYKDIQSDAFLKNLMNY